jgi:hypothetical protein
MFCSDRVIILSSALPPLVLASQRKREIPLKILHARALFSGWPLCMQDRQFPIYGGSSTYGTRIPDASVLVREHLCCGLPSFPYSPAATSSRQSRDAIGISLKILSASSSQYGPFFSGAAGTSFQPFNAVIADYPMTRFSWSRLAVPDSTTGAQLCPSTNREEKGAHATISLCHACANQTRVVQPMEARGGQAIYNILVFSMFILKVSESLFSQFFSMCWLLPVYPTLFIQVSRSSVSG